MSKIITYNIMSFKLWQYKLRLIILLASKLKSYFTMEHYLHTLNHFREKRLSSDNFSVTDNKHFLFIKA